jgi:hypothetical protein
LAAYTVVAPRNRGRVPFCDIVRYEHFLPSPARNVPRVYQLGTTDKTDLEARDKHRSVTTPLLSVSSALKIVDWLQKSVVRFSATLNIVGPPLKEITACLSYFGVRL